MPHYERCWQIRFFWYLRHKQSIWYSIINLLIRAGTSIDSASDAFTVRNVDDVCYVCQGDGVNKNEVKDS